MHKNWTKKPRKKGKNQVGFFSPNFILAPKMNFLPSFYALPKNVVKDKFVEIELLYKMHFFDFAGTKFFSSTLTIFHFRFNTQTAAL